MAAPIRMVILVQDLEFGGTQQYAIQLLRHLDHAQFTPELWILRGGFGLLAEASKAGLPVIRLTEFSRVTPQAVLRLAWRLFREPPRLLYTLTVMPNIWGRILGRLVRVPVIVSGYRSLAPKQWERVLWRLSDRIICNAEAAKDELLRRCPVDPARVAVIPNAVDTVKYCPQSAARAHQPTVLFVGRLVPEKDPLNLLEAFRLVATQLPEARLIIIGEGSLQPAMKHRIRTLALADHIRLLPASSNVMDALATAWVFTLPSTSEASPNVILEAMAAGLPVVATQVGGIPELVSHGNTGLLVPPGDPASLAQALLALLSDSALRQFMARNGREKTLTEHQIEPVVRRTGQVLAETAKRASGP